MAHVFATMGTVVSVRVDDDAVDAATLDAVEAVFDDLDREFSRWRPDSPASQIADGQLSLLRSSEAHRERYAEALRWRADTAGAFTPHRPDGTVDLAGTIKAAATEAAGNVLDAAGHERWCINAGGDVLTRGGTPAHPWTVALADPDDPQHVLRVVSLHGPQRAVATSGTSQRGEHVWRTDPKSTYRQVTIVADDLMTADVLATAILAGGPATRLLAEQGWPVHIVTVNRAGEPASSSGP
ncbi:FAD:protein FMN transferase [Frigoribacterium sp. PhB118]|uniref:FAD:protein FMN transferase n=1 Tax=Frigoribacterium sp. PhB118 TaxID=2485175 RepID=UPI000F4A0D7F|nr:FAD:protein FMN transferase [Frigoribacterium sp. PhB118]ROS49415.1 thiamine biosynthesis lipoprotein [Frigoribacterium sp. PhB118]